MNVPESCVGHREVWGEALTGVSVGHASISLLSNNNGEVQCDARALLLWPWGFPLS